MESLFLLCKRLSFALTVVCFMPVILGGGSAFAATDDIPHCQQVLGSVALTDPGKVFDTDMWWTRYHFAPPSQLLAKIIGVSGCFRVVPAGQNPDYTLTGDVAQRDFVSGENKSATYVSINSAAADVRLLLSRGASPEKSVQIVGHGDFSGLRYGRGGGIGILAAPDPKLNSYALSLTGQLVTLGFIQAYGKLIRQLKQP